MNIISKNSAWQISADPDSFRYGMSFLQPREVAICERVCRRWRSSIAVGQTVWKVQCQIQEVTSSNPLMPFKEQFTDPSPQIAFGKEQWSKHFGDVGVVPRLPFDIHHILKSSCPFNPSEKIEDTHVLVLIPERLNEKPMTLRRLGLLMQDRKALQERAGYIDNSSSLYYFGGYEDAPFKESHWILMTKDALSESRGQEFERQKELCAAYPHYQIPTLTEAITSIFMHYIMKQVRLLPMTFIRCHEKSSDGQMLIGGYSSLGLCVYNDAYRNRHIGIAAVRKFPAIEQQRKFANLYKQSFVEPSPINAWGKEQWSKHFGDIGEAPRLPSEIYKILKTACPFNPGKTIEQTHILVLVPAALNGKAMSLKRLGDLLKKFSSNDEKIGFRPGNFAHHEEEPFETSHWILMTKDVIHRTRQTSYKSQKKLIESFPKYRVPKLSEAVTAIFMEYIRSGIRCFNHKPWTATRCLDTHEDGHMIVGGFDKEGLSVGTCVVNSPDIGMAAVLSFAN